jgi:ketosteroid isomerase-like protein
MSIDPPERRRRSELVRAHFAAENAHDGDEILATFAPDGVMLYNRQTFPDPQSIRAGHAYIGMTAAPGAFAGLRAEIDAEHFTDDEVVIEGRLTGKHAAEFSGFPPTGREVELPFVSFYRFDANGKLVSERVVMNLGPLRE